MAIIDDPAKRAWTLRERKLDFNDAAKVFAGWTIDIPDLRRAYGERRVNTVSHLFGRMVIVCWTPRGNDRRIISMRKVDDREKALYRQRSAGG